MADEEKDPSFTPGKYLPATQELIDKLHAEPTSSLTCAHEDGEYAVAIYEVPRGCVALPGVETQPLCPQHRISDGSFEGMTSIVDLSINAAWSRYRGETPDFCMVKNGDEVEMIRLDAI